MAAASLEGPTRVVHCADALAWLPAQGRIAGASLVTSLPDVSEIAGATLETWRPWFGRAARLVLAACPDDGVTLFYQTDVIADGEWIDKGHLVTTAAGEVGARLLFHSIVCRQPPGTAVYGRPTYSHLLGFARRALETKSLPRVDVLPTTGTMIWTKGMGVAACAAAIEFVAANTPSRTIVDPFCGRGTVLAVANALGLDAVGVEIGKRRAADARRLRVTLPDAGAAGPRAR